MTGHRDRRFPLIMFMAFMLAHYCGISRAGELGRLFTTPEERSLLEKLRKPLLAGTSQLPPPDDPAIAVQQTGNSDVTVKGFVYRKNGRSTVWINSSFVHAHETPDRRLRITTDASTAADVLIDIPAGTAAIGVRPE